MLFCTWKDAAAPFLLPKDPFAPPCQILFRLGVEKLVLPAVPDVHATWKGAFGFQDCSPDSRKELSELEIMVFPGTTLLQKSVADAVSNHKQTAISALVGATLLSVVSDSGAPEKAPANGVALPYSTRWELSEWEELARNSHPPAKEEVKGLAAPEERKPGVPTLKRKRSGISSPVAGSSKGFRGLLPKGGGDVGQPRHLGPSQGGVPEVYSSKVVSGCPEIVFIGERQSAFPRDRYVFSKTGSLEFLYAFDKLIQSLPMIKYVSHSISISVDQSRLVVCLSP